MPFEAMRRHRLDELLFLARAFPKAVNERMVRH